MKHYEQVLEYLYNQLPYYQRSGPAAYKDNLDNTIALDRMFGHPHRQFKTIHVAGTNGKGSVSHMLASVLQHAGYKTGLYTSPHLKDFRERIRVDGEMISTDFVVDFVDRFRDKNGAGQINPSFFELTVMMAFDYFAVQKVDVAVIEVGLGGRLDSTNIITPELSIITNISRDHMALLGDTLGRIALEKAGIIKRKIPVVIGETHPQTSMIFEGKAAEAHAPIVFADQNLTAGYSMATIDGKQSFQLKRGEVTVYHDLQLDLLGRYQAKNIVTAVSAIERLQQNGWKIDNESLRNGLGRVVSTTGLLGRWQTLGANPRIVCDTGHNEAGIEEVVAQLKNTPCKKLHFVLGMVNDKDIMSVLVRLPRNAVYYFTKASMPRAMDEKLLKKMAETFHLSGETYPSVAEAVTAAKKSAEADDMIFIGGSTFVVAEVV